MATRRVAAAHHLREPEGGGDGGGGASATMTTTRNSPTAGFEMESLISSAGSRMVEGEPKPTETDGDGDVASASPNDDESTATTKVASAPTTAAPPSPPPPPSFSVAPSAFLPPLPVLFHSATFFLAMIVHELALEAASSAFPDLDALASSVTLFQFGFCVLTPIVSSRGSALETFPRTPRDCLPYVRLSVAVFGATALSTRSLSYVSYPTKVVFKSAKLIPTMIVSRIVNPRSSKRHGRWDYAAAALLCAGAAGYSFGGKSSGKGVESRNSGYGIALLTVSVFCDALVPNLQQKLMDKGGGRRQQLPTLKHHASDVRGEDSDGAAQSSKERPSSSTSGLSASALMVNANAVGFVGLLFFSAITGELTAAASAAIANPLLLAYLTFIGAGLGTAVLSYTKLIESSGSVSAVAVATLRKVATVVLSYVFFPKPATKVHVVSGLLVLGGMGLSAYGRRRR